MSRSIVKLALAAALAAVLLPLATAAPPKDPVRVEGVLRGTGAADVALIVAVTNLRTEAVADLAMGIEVSRPGHGEFEGAVSLPRLSLRALETKTLTLPLKTLRFVDAHGAEVPAASIVADVLEGALEIEAWICDARAVGGSRTTCEIWSEPIDVSTMTRD